MSIKHYLSIILVIPFLLASTRSADGKVSQPDASLAQAYITAVYQTGNLEEPTFTPIWTEGARSSATAAAPTVTETPVVIETPTATASPADPVPSPTPVPALTPTPTPLPLRLDVVEPLSLNQTTGGTITLLGEGFEEGLVVRLVGYGLLDSSCISSSIVHAEVPAGTTAGAYSIQVILTDGRQTNLEAALTILEPTDPVEPLPSPTPTPDMRQPALIVCGQTASLDKIKPGDEFSLTVTICNAGGLGIRDGMLSFEGLGFLTIGDKAHRFGEISPAGASSFTQLIRVPASAGPGMLAIEIVIQANDENGVLHSFKGSAMIEISAPATSPGEGSPPQAPRLVVVATETTPGIVTTSQPFELLLKVKNLGGRANQVMFKAVPDVVAGPVKGTESAYFDSIPAGAEVTVNLPLALWSQVQPGYYEISISVEYSISSGQPGSQEIKGGLEVLADASQRARVVVLSYHVKPDFVSQGDRLELVIQVFNVGGKKANQVAINLGGSPEGLKPFSPAGSGNLRYLPGLEPGETAEVSYSLIVDGKAEARAYNLAVDFSYEGDGEAVYSETQVISLLVQNRAIFRTGFYREVSFGTVGQQLRLPIELVNLSPARFNVANVVVSCRQIDFSIREAFAGKMESGGVFSLDATGIPQQGGQALIEITINYLDDFNQPQSTTQTLELEIREQSLSYNPVKEQQSETPPKEDFWQMLVRFLRGLFGLGS
jgi:hypothetical protein